MKKSALYLLALLAFFFTACNTESQRAYKEFRKAQAEENQADAFYGNEMTDVPGDYEMSNSNNEIDYSTNDSKNRFAQAQQVDMPNEQTQQTQNTNSKSGNIIMHTIPSSNNPYPFAQIPLPANWKINTTAKAGQPSIEGPNGVKVYDYAGQYLVYSSDPYMQQTYQMSGQTMKQPTGAKNVLQNDLRPKFNKAGYTFVKQYPLPQLAQANKNYDNKLWKSVPSQSKFDVLGSEWTDSKGNTTLVVLNYSENSGQGTVYWGYYFSAMEAPTKEFEAAKNNYINGLAGIQHNQQNIQAYNQSEQQKSNQSWASHNQKMANNQASFNASQKRLTDTYNDINKMSMDGYNSRSASGERTQNAYIDGIYEVENVYNGTNGQTYKVEAGAYQNWMNSNGEYIQSNNSNYDPNLDPNANQYNWQETQQVNP